MSRHSGVTVSVVSRISAYTIWCKSGGHSVNGFKVTKFWSPLPVPEGRKKPASNRVKCNYFTEKRLLFIHKPVPAFITNGVYLSKNSRIPLIPLVDYYSLFLVSSFAFLDKLTYCWLSLFFLLFATIKYYSTIMNITICN